MLFRMLMSLTIHAPSVHIYLVIRIASEVTIHSDNVFYHSRCGAEVGAKSSDNVCRNRRVMRVNDL